MKVTAVFVAGLATVSAFAPSIPSARTSTELMAAKKPASSPEKKPLFRSIFEMDLFAPVKDQNDYGARDKKNVSWATTSTLIEPRYFFDNIIGDKIRPFPFLVFICWSFANTYYLCRRSQLKVAKIGSNSYVPAGLTAAEYQKIRDADDTKKASGYKKNVAKAGKFKDYTEFYIKRGTDISDAWKKSPTLGHDMAKTKYDFSGQVDVQKSYDGKI